jgi:LacI family transcriptional regulator
VTAADPGPALPGPTPEDDATSWTVAREAGVSQSTVSRALRGDPRVREQTRRRVEEAARRLGYVPNALASSFSSRSTRALGVVVPDVANPFVPHLLTAVHDELQLLGYRVVLIVERTDLPVGQEALHRLLDRSIDGVLMSTATLHSPLAEALRARRLPLVLLDRCVDGLDADRVVGDDRAGAFAGARHLLRLGHRRIGAISGPSTTSTGRDRMLGLTDALAAAGVALDPGLVREGTHSHRSGYQHGRELLRLPDPPTALVCASDVVAFGALDAARSLDLRVPEDVSVLGFDDVPMAAWEVFQLSTLRRPFEEMARAAARMLAERVENGEAVGPGREQVFPVTLVQRATTGPAPARP